VRLFHELRDKLSLAYTLGCIEREFIDTGYIVFYVATIKDKIYETQTALRRQIAEVREKAVSDEELMLAKRELTSDLKINMQLNAFFTYTSALDELYGAGYGAIYKHESEIEKVTKDDVLGVAKKYLDPGASVDIVISSK